MQQFANSEMDMFMIFIALLAVVLTMVYTCSFVKMIDIAAIGWDLYSRVTRKIAFWVIWHGDFLQIAHNPIKFTHRSRNLKIYVLANPKEQVLFPDQEEIDRRLARLLYGWHKPATLGALRELCTMVSRPPTAPFAFRLRIESGEKSIMVDITIIMGTPSEKQESEEKKQTSEPTISITIKRVTKTDDVILGDISLLTILRNAQSIKPKKR